MSYLFQLNYVNVIIIVYFKSSLNDHENKCAFINDNFFLQKLIIGSALPYEICLLFVIFIQRLFIAAIFYISIEAFL